MAGANCRWVESDAVISHRQPHAHGLLAQVYCHLARFGVFYDIVKRLLCDAIDSNLNFIGKRPLAIHVVLHRQARTADDRFDQLTHKICQATPG